MPSKNCVNKPKGKLHREYHGKAISKKRANRARTSIPTRSSAGRYNTETAPRPTDSKSVALYTRSGPSVGSVVTTKKLSKKRAHKIERNNRYIAKRNEQLNIDLAAKQEDMEIDTMSGGKRQKAKEKTHLEKVRQALWTAVADSISSGVVVDASGEGTTIGIQAF